MHNYDISLVPRPDGPGDEATVICTHYDLTSDTLKCRSFLAQLGARMRNLRSCDNGKFPFQFDLRGQSVRACTV